MTKSPVHSIIANFPQIFDRIWRISPIHSQYTFGSPLRWKRPTVTRIKCVQGGDLFHRDVPFDFIDKVFAVMAMCQQHTFQALTKRPERMAEYLNDSRDGLGLKTDERVNAEACHLHHLTRSDLVPELKLGFPRSPVQSWPLPNVWLGTSIENQAAADERIPYLLKCPAAVRFLSCEPLLGPVNLAAKCPPFYAPHLRSDRIPWVIVGCESGAGRRPMNLDWVRSLRDQCQTTGTAVFVKQIEVGGHVTGEIEEFPADLQIRQFPNAVIRDR